MRNLAAPADRAGGPDATYRILVRIISQPFFGDSGPRALPTCCHRLLLDRGADPNARASIRKRLPFARDKAVHEYRDVTPLGWGRRFHDQSYVSAAAMRVIAERGGRE